MTWSGPTRSLVLDLQRGGNPTQLGDALAHFGRIFKTLHVLAYVDREPYRRGIKRSGQLQARGVDLLVLDQGIDTSTAVGRMFFQILGSIAEFEHALMSGRTLDGLAATRARGRTGGQKPKLGPRQVALARQMYDETGADGKRKHPVPTDRRRVRGHPPIHYLPPPRHSNDVGQHAAPLADPSPPPRPLAQVFTRSLLTGRYGGPSPEPP